MTHRENDIEDVLVSQEDFERMIKERLRHAVRVALISILEEEVTVFIGAEPYERKPERTDQRKWDPLRICPFRVRVVDIRPSFLSATSVVKVKWIVRLGRCSSRE